MTRGQYFQIVVDNPRELKGKSKRVRPYIQEAFDEARGYQVCVTLKEHDELTTQLATHRYIHARVIGTEKNRDTVDSAHANHKESRKDVTEVGGWGSAIDLRQGPDDTKEQATQDGDGLVSSNQGFEIGAGQGNKWCN